MKEVKIKPAWMVLARHYWMEGGVFDYGMADIKEFFTSFKEADKFARELFKDTRKDLIQPVVWVLKCEKTYREGGVAVSKKA